MYFLFVCDKLGFECDYLLCIVCVCVCVFFNKCLHVSCDEDTPLIVPKHCQTAGLGTSAGCEDHA